MTTLHRTPLLLCRALPLRASLLAAVLAVLGGCTGTVPVSNPGVDQAQSGVTVYGTVDAGVSRTQRKP